MKVKEESEKVGLKLNIQKTKIMASGPITSWQIDGETVRDFLFGSSKITADGRHYFAYKGPSSQGYGFSSSHVWMWKLDHKESWALKNWCFWAVVLEKTLESPLDHKEIKPVNPQGNQSWIFTGRTDAEAETPILWPPDAKNWLVGKKPWCWERMKAGEGNDRGWDGWMASLTQWTWVWTNSKK